MKVCYNLTIQNETDIQKDIFFKYSLKYVVNYNNWKLNVNNYNNEHRLLIITTENH